MFISKDFVKYYMIYLLPVSDSNVGQQNFDVLFSLWKNNLWYTLQLKTKVIISGYNHGIKFLLTD